MEIYGIFKSLQLVRDLKYFWKCKTKYLFFKNDLFKVKGYENLFEMFRDSNIQNPKRF